MGPVVVGTEEAERPLTCWSQIGSGGTAAETEGQGRNVSLDGNNTTRPFVGEKS